MPKMSTSELKAILAAERLDALASTQASKLTAEREKAMQYYLGDMSQDMPAPEGRSRAVSSDVADTIEGMMPTFMDIFFGGDDVVAFEPVGQEDEPLAEQETDYVNYVFTQRNPGFLALYSFIKDALLSKVGVVKVWWEKEEKTCRESYSGLTEEQFIMVLNQPNIQVIEHSTRPMSDAGSSY